MLNNLITYFVDRLPDSGRTQIVKYLYLADLESRRHRGVPLTTLNWMKHNDGPFDKAILEALDLLTSRDVLEDHHATFPNGYVGTMYRTVRTPRLEFSDAEQAILDIVVKQYGGMPLQRLLDDVVYESAPMKSAVEKQPLNMACVNNEASIKGINLEDAWSGFRDAQKGRTVPFDEAFRRARSG